MATANDKPSVRPEVQRYAKLAALESCLRMHEGGWSISALCKVHNDIPAVEIREYMQQFGLNR